MANCPSNCEDLTLVGNPPGECVVTYRSRILSRIGYYPCYTDLPVEDEEAMQQLFADGTIVVSSEIVNPAWGEPTFVEIPIRACAPPLRVIESRELTFEDRIAVSQTTGSPAVTDAYHDYAFYQDKVENQALMNTMLIFCDGDVIVPENQAGVPLGATMTAFITYQPPTTAGGQFIEFKSVSIMFQGDPLAFYTARPAFNLVDYGITL